MPTQKPKPKSKNTATNNPVTRFVMNEMLGVDDFKRAYNYARKGQYRRATKSLAAGVIEGGSTAVGAAGLKAIGTGAKVAIRGSKAASAVTKARTMSTGKKVTRFIEEGRIPSSKMINKSAKASNAYYRSDFARSGKLLEQGKIHGPSVKGVFSKQAEQYRKAKGSMKRGSAVVGGVAAGKTAAMKKRNTKRGN